ncbi:SPIRAL1-like1 [Hibiscus trionum]|uniref:SPIRAL1-like1 n=1 Tax=Hibiscus trionum TaxID=183268 RepID=A0A9W7LUY1_HIBTR|nr:SPIRAL1-like1 [Hibiscus trionum]
MGRGVSSGGGQSSLGYLFGSGEAPKPTIKNASPTPSTDTSNEVPRAQNEVAKETPQNSAAASPPAGVTKEIPAGIPRNNANNYSRADGQNCGNFLTDRPTTKVHAAPGGGSSLDYLFGGNGK